MVQRPLRVGALIVAILMAFGCATRSRWERAIADPAGQEFAALVDSEEARILLTDLLRDGYGPGIVTGTATAASADFGQNPGAAPLRRVPSQAELRALAQEVSMDFAALTFARAIGADARSRAVQEALHRSIEEGPDRCEEILRKPEAFPYTVLFVPSWLYRSHPETGSDFARQRRLLDRLGIAYRVIDTAESGSIEDNAAVIASAVREAGRRQEAVVLVSASKSGAEAAFALTRLLTHDEAAGVVAWLNIAGALQGTPLADTGIRPPVSWFARAMFWVTRWDWAGLASMATEPSRRRLANARMPDSIAVVNVIAVPVSGSVGYQVFFGYQVLRRYGPNDGVVLLADTAWPVGANVVILGADHLMASTQTDGHGMALLRAVDFAVRLHRTPLLVTPLR